MSWKLEACGSQEHVIRAVQEYGDRLMGEDAVAYADAKPLLLGILSQTFDHESVGAVRGISLLAAGSGMADGERSVHRVLHVHVTPFFMRGHDICREETSGTTMPLTAI